MFHLHDFKLNYAVMAKTIKLCNPFFIDASQATAHPDSRPDGSSAGQAQKGHPEQAGESNRKTNFFYLYGEDLTARESTHPMLAFFRVFQ